MSTREEWAEIIAVEAEVAGLRLSEAQAALAGRHAAELLAWNPGANLTRLTDPRDVARRHFVESFLATRLLPAPGPEVLRVLDVGAGGGFPGLALRVLRPDVGLLMLEPRRRKAAFLRHVASLQPPPKPRVETLRLEELRPKAPFDVVTFRAVRLAGADILRVLAAEGLVLGFPGGEDDSLVREMEGAGLAIVGSTPLPDQERQILAWSRPAP